MLAEAKAAAATAVLAAKAGAEAGKGGLGREGSELSPPLAYRLRIMTFRAGSGTPCVETPIALVNELGGHVLALFRS